MSSDLSSAVLISSGVIFSAPSFTNSSSGFLKTMSYSFLHFHFTRDDKNLRVGISPLYPLVLPMLNKERAGICLLLLLTFSALPFCPVAFRMDPNRVGSFGGKEVIETRQKIFISIIIAHAFSVHPDINSKLLKRFR